MGDDSYSEDVYSEFEEDSMALDVHIDTKSAWTREPLESEPAESEREMRTQLYSQLKNSGVLGNVKVSIA